MFTSELKSPRLHIKICENPNPAVRTRNDEVVSCSDAADSSKPFPLKRAFPKQPNASEQKLSPFPQVLGVRTPSAKPDRPKPALA